MKQAKRILGLLLALLLVVGSVGCGAKPEQAPAAQSTPEAPSADAPAAEQTEPGSTAVLDDVPGDEFDNAMLGRSAAVSSYSAITSQVGIDILEAGGNAVDAAVATIFAVGVCEPHHSGIGGCGLMTVYLADTDTYTTIEFMEALPLNYDGTYTKAKDNQTARGAAVPGQVAGLLYALEKYGTMTPAEVLAPAIKLAREGFPLDSVVTGAMNDSVPLFLKDGYEYMKQLYTYMGTGIPYSDGDIFVNEDLANTLQAIADGGADAFYKGEIAEKLVAGLQANGSWITMKDFASYQPKERIPVSTEYYGYNIVGVSYPTAGGVWELESLNIMEAMDIAQYKQGSADYWRVFNEAVRIGALDAYTYFGNVDKYNLPVDTLVSQNYADERAGMISLDSCIEAVPTSDLGDKDAWGLTGDNSLDENTSTTHIAVIDASGNIVSSTNTVGYSFGCNFAVEGTGFCLNNHMLNNRNVEPGEHIKSSMSPTIVTRDGKPIMAVGSPGSRVIPCAIMSVINNTLLYGMSVQEAINAERCFILSYNGNKPLTTLTAETGRMGSSLIRQLELYGYSFEENVNDYDAKLGGIAAIYIDPDTGMISAGGDPRRNYAGLAY